MRLDKINSEIQAVKTASEIKSRDLKAKQDADTKQQLALLEAQRTVVSNTFGQFTDKQAGDAIKSAKGMMLKLLVNPKMAAYLKPTNEQLEKVEAAWLAGNISNNEAVEVVNVLLTRLEATLIRLNGYFSSRQRGAGFKIRTTSEQGALTVY